MEENIYIKDFANRVVMLRSQKNLTARDMSLSLGQSHNFINSIESERNFPSMLNFFYMCEFLDISPRDFFDYDNPHSARTSSIMTKLDALSDEQFKIIASVIEQMNK